MKISDLVINLTETRTPEQVEESEATKKAKDELLQRFIPTDDSPGMFNKGYKKLLNFYPRHYDEWMACDVWDTETAIKIITIGYPIDFTKDWWDDKKNDRLYLAAAMTLSAQVTDETLFGKQTLERFKKAYSHGLSLAESAIARGKLKAIDTPLNWIAWAKSERFNTDHLDPLLTIDLIKQYQQSTIDYENCNEDYRKEYESLQEIIDGWQKIADIWGLTKPQTTGTGSQETKKRKKLKPFERDCNEGLLLINELVQFYKVEYLDDLKTSKAWGLIVSGEFKSDLIKSVSYAKTFIILSGGEKLDKTTFSDKYRRRFE